MEDDMHNQSLSSEERAYLLDLARRSIESVLQQRGQEKLDFERISPRLQEPGAAFVTLHTIGGLLRGCIGSLQARRPLVEDVRYNAIAAAFEDPRFPPLRINELPSIVVEVSVLSTPQPLEYSDAEDLVLKLRPGIDGVVLESGWHRATFLPQVWEQLPTHHDFLSHLCLKAGLPADAWHSADMKISTYQVEEFTEKG
jgi:AmmeMemoRadiSam system protein A